MRKMYIELQKNEDRWEAPLSVDMGPARAELICYEDESKEEALQGLLEHLDVDFLLEKMDVQTLRSKDS